MRFFTVDLRLRHALFTIGTLVTCFLFTPTAYAAAYIWIGTGGNNNWSNANNWDPARTPANDDVLIFDGSRTAAAAVIVDFASPQTIGQLRVINNIWLTFTIQPAPAATSTSPARSLSITGNFAGEDFEVERGTVIQVVSPLVSTLLPA